MLGQIAAGGRGDLKVPLVILGEGSAREIGATDHGSHTGVLLEDVPLGVEALSRVAADLNAEEILKVEELGERPRLVEP